MIISIDPGLNHNAYALWDEKKKLNYAALVANPLARNKKLTRPEVWSAAASALVKDVSLLALFSADLYVSLGIVIELPKVRQRGSGKGDPNDLIDVAGVASAIVVNFKITMGAHVLWSPYPEEWKGQLPKEISSQRVDEKLSVEEKTKIKMPVAGLMHNVTDSIHLGLVHLKRA